MIPVKVDLIDSTGAGSPDPARIAATKLIYTKSTRLEQGRGTFERISVMSDEGIKKELEYMANTIPSSWEMCNYTFQLKNVTRAFTHQFVRTRTGSYAQQTMRMLNKSEFTYRIPPRIKALGKLSIEYQRYCKCMEYIQESYDSLISMGCEVEDARGVLPTNIHTNIIAQFNLRTIAEMSRSRTGLRTQDEYREVLEQMLACVVEVHPWTELFLFPEKLKNIKILEKFVTEQLGDGGVPEDEKYTILKALDKIRKGED